MKKITVLVLMLVGLSTVTFAQRGNHDRGNPEEMAQKRAEKMKEELKLTEKQYTQILELNKLQIAKRAEKREANREAIKANREEMKKERAAYDSSLQGILSPEQYEKHKAQMELRKDKGDRRPGNRRGRN